MSLLHHLIGRTFTLTEPVPDGVVSAGLGSLHHRHPLVIITEEGEVKVRTAAVGLGADRQLAQQPTYRLGVASVFGVHYGVFESEAQTDGDISTMTLNSNRKLHQSLLSLWPGCKTAGLQEAVLL